MRGMRKITLEELRRGILMGPDEEPEESPDEEMEDPEEGLEMGYADATDDTAPDDGDAAQDSGDKAPDPEAPDGAESDEDYEFPWADIPIADAVRKMKGADELAALIDELTRIAPTLKQREITDVLASRAYLFSINAGCGISTAVATLARVYIEQELAKLQKMPVEITVPGDLAGGQITDNLIKLLEQFGDRVVCLDITQWLNRGRDPEFLNMLLKLYEHRYHQVLVFRVPYMEQSEIANIADALRDVFSIRTVVFTPLLAKQLEELATERLRDCGYIADNDAMHLFEVRVAEEKSDGRFYGITTLERIADEMVYCKLLSGSAGDTITREDLRGFVRHDDMDPELPAADELLGMAGMRSVSDELRKIVGEIGADPARKKPMNICFIGSQGTGKTMVARILGKLLREKNILEHGYLLEHRAADLLGEYVGSTGPQTMQICSDARGSILYLDELHTLKGGDDEDGGRAREALDTLTAEIGQGKGELLVILAGTEAEIDALMRANPALAEQMPYRVHFAEYSRDELAAIFMKMVSQSRLGAGEGLEEAVTQYFRELPDNVYRSKEFTYARYVRNLFEKTLSKEIARSRIRGGADRVILAGDFSLACGESKRELNRKQKDHRIIGFQA
jgi:hypothetical protein